MIINTKYVPIPIISKIENKQKTREISEFEKG